jgi:ADP-ribose pyrophosphatase
MRHGAPPIARHFATSSDPELSRHIPQDKNMADETADAFGPEIALHSRKLVFENAVFHVFADHVSDRDGHVVPQYLSVIPRHAVANNVTGVSLLPVMGDKVGLIRVFRHPLRRWCWEAPRGFIDTGESAEQAALRELREETGFDVAAASLRPLGLVAPEAGVLCARVAAYAAQIDGAQPAPLVPLGELGHGKLQFFSHDEVTALTAAGELEDACTLAMMYLYWIGRRQGPP